MNIDWIQASTIVTAIATVAYAILTLVIVRETVALRRAQTEPNIVLLLELTLEYENESRKKRFQKFTLDPALFYGNSWIGNQPDTADTLQAIQREIRDLVIGFKRIKVEVYDKNDRAKEKRERQKQL